MATLSASRFARRTRLGFEELSTRIVPAVVVTQLDLDADGAADDIRIVGDKRLNKVAVIDDGSASVKIQIDANGDGDITDSGIL